MPLAANSGGKAQRLQEGAIQGPRAQDKAQKSPTALAPSAVRIWRSGVGRVVIVLDDGNVAPETERAGAAGHRDGDGGQKDSSENSVHTHLRNTKWTAIGVASEGEFFWLRNSG